MKPKAAVSNPAQKGKIVKKTGPKPRKTTPRKATSPTKPKQPAMKSPAERIIDAMRELAHHLRHPHECLTLEAYGVLEAEHKVLFDNLLKAISKRTFGENQDD